MTEEQVYEAFGEDVQLMKFVEYEADDELTSINVIFDEVYLAEDGDVTVNSVMSLDVFMI